MKRVYCARPSCSRFLGAQYEGVLPSRLAPRLKCPEPGCCTITCSWCKNSVGPLTGAVTGVGWLKKHRCGESEGDGRVLALGRQVHWTRCPGCATLVELSTGCNHMRCRCGTQFCYICGGRWRTCKCSQWEEQRIVGDAAEGEEA